MLPTFKEDGDVVVVSRIVPNGYKRGDVVISVCKTDPNKTVCKRISALPGDYITRGYLRGVVPSGHVYLLGDNPRNSNDSRNYGPVPIGLLRGRVIWKLDVVYPFVKSIDRWK
jgi:mitochondrial inner membrane protease subunit 1